MNIGRFQHRKTGRIVEAPWVYNWGKGWFWAKYLGRVFYDGGEHPYIGKDWKYVGNKTTNRYKASL